MNSSSCHCTYCVPLFFLCCYYYVQATALSKVERHLIRHLSTFRRFAHTACVLVYISLVVTTSS